MGLIVDPYLGVARDDRVTLAALAAVGVGPRYKIVGTLAEVLAVTGVAGDEAFATNLGAHGCRLSWSAAAGSWRVDGSQALHTQRSPLTGTATTTEQVMSQLVLPIGWRSVVGALRVYISFGRTGATDTATARLRVGNLGTISDANLGSTQISGTGRNLAGTTEVVSDTATTIGFSGAQNYGVSPWPWSAGTAVIPLNVTVANMDTNVTYLTLGIAMGGTTDLPQLRTFVVEAVR